MSGTMMTMMQMYMPGMCMCFAAQIPMRAPHQAI